MSDDAISGLGFKPTYLSLFTPNDAIVTEATLASSAPPLELVASDKEGFSVLVDNTILRFNYSDAQPPE